jgi:hypothetical protein
MSLVNIEFVLLPILEAITIPSATQQRHTPKREALTSLGTISIRDIWCPPRNVRNSRQKRRQLDIAATTHERTY